MYKSCSANDLRGATGLGLLDVIVRIVSEQGTHLVVLGIRTKLLKVGQAFQIKGGNGTLLDHAQSLKNFQARFHSARAFQFNFDLQSTLFGICQHLFQGWNLAGQYAGGRAHMTAFSWRFDNLAAFLVQEIASIRHRLKCFCSLWLTTLRITS
jgi:hypothetical protein